MDGPTDFLVIGAGIAGASAAYELAARGSVRLLERESLPGTHTTGRSAAFLVGSYGTAVVQRLTRAGRDFLESPPEGFSSVPILAPRPSLTVARADQTERLAADSRRAREAGVALVDVDPAEAGRLFPALRPGYAVAASLEVDSKSIDVAALLAGFLRGFRDRGGLLETGFEVGQIAPRGSGWRVECGQRRFEAGVVVNAAGAWGERVGTLAGCRPLGLRPLRRTAITFQAPAGANAQTWPCVLDAEEEFYVKPEGGGLLASPCDETPSEPCDAVPEDLAVAEAVDRVQRATTLEIHHVGRRWAGLRSFVADRGPVIGMDAERSGFFWLVGQGGFGIMTSPAAARAAAALITDGKLSQDLRDLDLRAEDLSPERESLRRPGASVATA